MTKKHLRQRKASYNSSRKAPYVHVSLLRNHILYTLYCVIAVEIQVNTLKRIDSNSPWRKHIKLNDAMRLAIIKRMLFISESKLMDGLLDGMCLNFLHSSIDLFTITHIHSEFHLYLYLCVECSTNIQFAQIAMTAYFQRNLHNLNSFMALTIPTIFRHILMKDIDAARKNLNCAFSNVAEYLLDRRHRCFFSVTKWEWKGTRKRLRFCVCWNLTVDCLASECNKHRRPNVHKIHKRSNVDQIVNDKSS